MKRINQKGSSLIETVISIMVIVLIFSTTILSLHLLYFKMIIPNILYEFLSCKSFYKEEIFCESILKRKLQKIQIASKISQINIAESKLQKSISLKIKTNFGNELQFNENIKLPIKFK